MALSLRKVLNGPQGIATKKNWRDFFFPRYNWGYANCVHGGWASLESISLLCRPQWALWAHSSFRRSWLGLGKAQVSSLSLSGGRDLRRVLWSVSQWGFGNLSWQWVSFIPASFSGLASKVVASDHFCLAWETQHCGWITMVNDNG